MAQKRNAELTIAADDNKGKEKRTLVMKAENAIALGVWLPEDPKSEKFLEVRFERLEDNSVAQKGA